MTPLKVKLRVSSALAVGRRFFGTREGTIVGLPARETNLIKSLARAVGTSGKMPLRGPFMATEEIDEIVAWIDGGMPEGP